MSNKKTHEEFLKNVETSHGAGKYTVLGAYVHSDSHIEVQCNICNHKWNPIAKNFVKKHAPTGCPECARRKKTKSHEEFVSDVEVTHGVGKYTVLETYTNALNPILIQCNICGYDKWRPLAASVIDKNKPRGCPKCFGNAKKTHEEFINEVEEIHGVDRYSVLGMYVNDKTRIKIKCNVCEHEWNPVPGSIINRENPTGCPRCGLKQAAKKMTKTTEEWLNNIKEINEKENCIYVFIDKEYKGAREKILMQHICDSNGNYCGHTYEIAPVNFITGNRCPKCKMSKGEKRINKYLRNNNIKFKDQYRFNNCRNKNPLPFDFVIFNEDGSIMCLIEYDGDQHFKPSFGEERLKQTKINDRIKDDYCKQNNIKLYRIPYWKYDRIENILDEII